MFRPYYDHVRPGRFRVSVRQWRNLLLTHFLLGAAEIGFFPGVILCLTYWFPKACRGIAAINMLAHLGTGAVTSLIGVLKQQTGTYPVSLLPLCVLIGVGAVVVLWIGHVKRPVLVISPAE